MDNNQKTIKTNGETTEPNTLIATVKKFFGRLKSLCSQYHKSQYHLLSYAPTKNKSYDVYAKELLHCIKNEDMKNIAITGANGSGKSSAIEQLKLYIYKRGLPFFRLGRKSVKTVSFLAIDDSRIVDKDNNDADDSTALEGKEGNKDATETKKVISKRELVRQAIQWEIVKQLVFSVKPTKTPSSRYFRIGRARWCDPIIILTSLIFGVVLEMIISAQRIYEAFRNIAVDIFLHSDSLLPYPGDHAALLRVIGIIGFSLLSYLFVYRAVKFFHDHPLKSLKLKDFTLNFQDGIPDFEQMSDELIYLFKRAKIRVVVLEDIDRFNDPLIYEDLRQLNNLLNNAVRHKVTFIYALKADLIPEIEKRSKLFDVTIPVVPVITSDNATGIIKHEFEKVGFQYDGISKIISIIGDNVHDMRSIKAICNGAFILRSLIQNGGSIGQKLHNYEEMIAIATIRELYPVEYQNLCNNTGDSVIDNVFSECQENRNKKIAVAESNLSKAKHLPELIAGCGDLAWKQLNTAKSQKNDAKVIAITLDGKKIERKDVEEMDFVNKLNTGSILRVTEEYAENYYHKKNIDMEYRAADLRRLISGEYGDLVDIAKLPVEDYEKQVMLANEEDPFVEYGELSADRRAELLPGGKENIIGRMILDGILDQNYRLYIAPFSNYNEYSAGLVNFNLNYLQKNIPNYEYRLSDEDIAMLLNEHKYYLGTPMLHNYSIASYLIRMHSDELNIMLAPRKEDIQSLARFSMKWLGHRREEIFQSMLSRRITIDNYATEPVLVFLSKIAQRYFLETLTIFTRTADNISHWGTKNFILAIILSSAPDFYKDSKCVDGIDADVLHALDKNVQSLVQYDGIEDVLAEIFRINRYKVENLSAFSPNSHEVMDLIQTNSFRFTPKNLQWIHKNNFDDIVKSYGLSKDDLQLLLGLQSSIPSNIRKLILSNVGQYYQLIADDRQLAKQLGEALIVNNIKIDQKDLGNIASIMPDDITIKVILVNKESCTATILREIFCKMSDPYCRLARSKARPMLPDNRNSWELIKLLENLDMVYPANSTKVIVKDFETVTCDE